MSAWRTTNWPPLVLLLLTLGCVQIEERQVELSPATQVTGTDFAAIGVTAPSPHYEGDERVGIHLGDVRPGTIADDLGLARGDIIVEMAGVPCDNLERCRTGARRFQTALARRRPFSLVIQRQATALRFRYRFGAVTPLGVR